MLHIPPYVDKAAINVSQTEPRSIYFALECIEKKSTVEKPSSEKLALSKGCTTQATRNSCFTLNLRRLKAIECQSKNCEKLAFLGPRGPLVLPLVGPVPSRPSALKIWITYIQAYMPYES